MKSIKSKIFIFALLSTLIPSLVLGYLSFHQNEELINDNVKRELRILASSASHEIDAWIVQNIREANSLTSAKIVIHALSDMANTQNNHVKASPEILSQYLRSVHDKLENYLELTVLDAKKHIIASSSDHPISSKTFSEPWLKRKKTPDPLISPPSFHESYQTVTISVALPIISYEDYILGHLLLIYDLQQVKSLLKSPKSPRGEILLLDSIGQVVLASHTDINHPLLLNQITFDYLQDNPGEFTTYNDALLGDDAIGLAYKAKILPISVLAEKSHHDVYAAWLEQRNLYFVLVGISILIVATIAVYLGRSIVTPLHRLIDATGRIVKGNLDVPITVVTQKDEVGKLARMFNLMMEKLRQSQSEILAANKELQEKNQLLEKLSVTDSLTGLYNRNKLNLIIDDQLLRFQRNKRPFSILMIDVDYFKELNDQLGHVAGDEILSAIARNISRPIRSIDFAARYGGDEFIIILTETTVQEAAITAERIRLQTSEIDCKTINSKIKITLSIGIAQSELQDTSAISIITRADSALYEAKNAGRNRAYITHPVHI